MIRIHITPSKLVSSNSHRFDIDCVHVVNLSMSILTRVCELLCVVLTFVMAVEASCIEDHWASG